MAAQLWEPLGALGLSEFAPVFVDCRVASLQEIPANAALLLYKGVPKWH